jgi:GR25 family glycosyltransferase involved in LPS biosynthesis
MFPHKVFVINLDESKERWNRIHQNLNTFGVPHERFSGVNGRLLDEGTKKKYVSSLCRSLTCTPGMIGCALSHMFLWKKIVDENIDSCIILEDDAVWLPTTTDKIIKLSGFSRSLIKLHSCGMGTKQPVLNFRNPLPMTHAPSLAGYLLYKEVAEQLLYLMPKVKYHLDLQMDKILKMVKTYYYPCIETNGFDDSLINETGSRKELDLIPSDIRWALSSPLVYPLGTKIDGFFCIGAGVVVLIVIIVVVLVVLKKMSLKEWVLSI